MREYTYAVPINYHLLWDCSNLAGNISTFVILETSRLDGTAWSLSKNASTVLGLTASPLVAIYLLHRLFAHAISLQLYVAIYGIWNYESHVAKVSVSLRALLYMCLWVAEEDAGCNKYFGLISELWPYFWCSNQPQYLNGLGPLLMATNDVEGQVLRWVMTPMTFMTTICQTPHNFTNLYLFSVTLHSFVQDTYSCKWPKVSTATKFYNRILTCYNRECLIFTCVILYSGGCFMHA